MKILAIGDVVGRAALDYIKRELPNIRSAISADFVVCNGENVCDIRGLTPADADTLLASGVDLITTGNHVYGQRSIYDRLDDDERIIRPCNYPAEARGTGYTILDALGYRLLCINALGTVFLDPLDNPFCAVEKILAREEGRYDFSLLDFHAEATSEKLAMAYFLDGRVNIVFGTHTHVQTADETVLSRGTGYITDLGMTGPDESILGTAPEPVIERFRTHMPHRFAVAEGRITLCGALFDLDTGTGRVRAVSRVRYSDK